MSVFPVPDGLVYVHVKSTELDTVQPVNVISDAVNPSVGFNMIDGISSSAILEEKVNLICLVSSKS